MNLGVMTDYHLDLQERLGCGSLIDALEARFNSYLEQKRYESRGDALAALRQIKLFLHEEKQFRLEALKSSKIGGTDCLTLSTITALLADRLGHPVFVTAPRTFARMLHANVEYFDDGERKTFSVAGRRRFTNVRRLSPTEVAVRLTLSRRLVQTGATVAGRLGLRRSR